MVLAFQQCESHPGRPLTEHLCDVAGRLQSCSGAPRWLRPVGLFHDVGKATGYFQAYLRGASAPSELKRHSEIGALWLLHFLSTHPEYCGGSIAEIALAFQFVKRHHGRLDDLLDSLIFKSQSRERFQKQIDAMDVQGIQEWLSGQVGLPISVVKIDNAMLTELRVKANRALQEVKNEMETMARFQSALQWFGFLIESDHDSAAGYSSGYFDLSPQLSNEHIDRFRAIGDYGVHANEFVCKARELVYQTALSSTDRSPSSSGYLWTLTVPTGAGKTLAALGWALKR